MARVRLPRWLPLIVLVAGCDAGAIPTSADAIRPSFDESEEGGGTWTGPEVPIAVTLTGADQVWSITKGYGVKVGIIDEGFDPNHADLPNFTCVGSGNCSYSGLNHGTLAAGVLAASEGGLGIVGVAPDVNLYVCKGTNGSERASCVYALRDAGVRIISMSWPDGSTALKNAIQAVYNQGNVLFFAEANNFWYTSSSSTPPGTVNPASYPEVHGVSGVMPDRNFAHPSFSSQNASLCPWPVQSPLGSSEWGNASNYGSYVDIAGPFYTRTTRWDSPSYPDEYRLVCGTSFATPAVAGVAALVWATDLSMSRDEVWNYLKTTAEDRGANGKDPYYGWGVVRAVNAVNAAVGGGVSASQSTVSVNKTSMDADGQDAVTVTVTARNAQGSPLSGQSVTLSVSGSGNTITQPGSTSGSGVAVGSFRTTAAGTKIVSAVAGGVSINNTPTVTASAPAPSLNVSINGPYAVPKNAGEICNWFAQWSGGSGAPTYEWKWGGQVVSYQDFYVSDEGTAGWYQLQLTVTTTSGATGSDTRWVEVVNTYDPSGYCGF